MYDKGVIDTRIYKSKYQIFPEVLKSRLRGSILKQCTKVKHVENGILNFSPIRKNRNDYPRKENNFGDDSSMVLLYDEHVGNTIVAGNTDLSGNLILEIRDLVLSYLHIGLHTGDSKYRI